MSVISTRRYVQPSSQSGHLTVPSFLFTHSCFSQVLFLHFKKKKKKSKQPEDLQRSLVSGLLLYHLWFYAFQIINNTFSSKNLSQWSYINLLLAIQAISETNTTSFWLAVIFCFTCKFYSAFASIPSLWCHPYTVWFPLSPFKSFRHPHADKPFGRTVI